MAEAKENYSSGRKIFLCRYKVDKSPGLQATLEIVLGTVAFAHFFASLLLLFVDEQANNDQGNAASKANAVIPLILLCSEVTVLSLCIAAIVIKDMCCTPKDSLSVWQREALGRLLRNVVIGTLLGMTCVLWYKFQLESTSSAVEVVTPALIAACIAAAKVVLIRTDRTWFWLGLSVLSAVQILLLILKYDFQFSIPWMYLCTPVYVLSLDAMFLSITIASEFLSSEQAEKVTTVLFCSVKVAACVMLIITTVLAGQFADGVQNVEKDTLALLVLLTFFLCFVSLCRLCGNYILDIVWGHVETDFLHLKYPVLLSRQHTP